MTDQQRTEAWNNMPEQMRKEITTLYQSYWITFNTRKRMEEIFGDYNLTSDTEPEEMLMVSRKDVQEQYERHQAGSARVQAYSFCKR